MDQNRAMARMAARNIITSDDVSDPILAGLNTAQSFAVTNPAPVVQILAPPGSGKTRTLTSRVAYLLSPSQGLSPQNVIVATFTVKAAREMKERISKLVGNGVEAKLVLGTFHSIARRYLVRYGHMIGLRNGWGIADNGDSIGIVKRILKRRGIPITDAKAVRSRISYFKARNTSPVANAAPKVVGTQVTQSTQQKEKSISTEDFVLVFQDYEAGLVTSNLLDYDDLLLRCLELLKQYPECVGNVEAVLIDEFQDTNLVQFELMRSLASKQNHITIVGDPDQSIYGFRAAEIRNLSRMLRVYPDTLVVHLEQNYRSSASILLAALEVIQQDDSRPQKPLTPTHAVGTRPVLRKLPSAEREAAWIVAEIARVRALTGGAVGLGDIAVLVRSASLTRLIETYFVRAGMAYKMVGGLKFYDRVEIKTMLDYLRVIYNPLNNDAVARIVNVPSRKVGDTTIKLLLDEAESKGKSLWDVIKIGVSGGWRDLRISKIADKGLGDFVGIILSTQRLLRGEEDEGEEKTLVEIIEYLLRKLAYEEHLVRHYPEDWEGRWSNITELLTQARDMAVVEEEDALPLIDGVQQSETVATGLQDVLERFLSNTALSEVPEDEEKKAQGQVTISTIHAAKGLEWPIVFIPAVYAGSIPHSRADDTDEERRLLYVAMTRAQGLLYMSCPRRSSSKEKTTPSPFLTPSSVTRLLDKRAPPLQFSSMQGILQILGRTCPGEVVINTVIEKAGIPSLLDDQIPEMEEWEKREEDGEEGSEGDDWKRRKRKRPEDIPGGVYDLGGKAAAVGWNHGGRGGNGGFMTAEQRLAAKTTTAEKLIVAAAAGNAGFRSAGTHMEALKQKRLACEADKERVEKKARHDAIIAKSAAAEALAAEKRAALSTKLAGGKSTIVARSNKRAIGQGSLMSYFVPKSNPKPAKEKTATEVMKQSRKQGLGLGLSLKEQMEALPQPKLPVRPNGGVVLLSSSPVRVKERRKKEPSLELEIPSSPVFEEFCRSFEEGGADIVGAGYASASVETVAGGSRTTVTATAGFSSVGSLSMSTAEQRLSGKMTTADRLAAAGGAKKRTLGIRRSMNGWENRASAKK